MLYLHRCRLKLLFITRLNRAVIEVARILWPFLLADVVALQISCADAVSSLQISLMWIHPRQPFHASLPWLSEEDGEMLHWSYFQQCYIMRPSICLRTWSGVMLHIRQVCVDVQLQRLTETFKDVVAAGSSCRSLVRILANFWLCERWWQLQRHYLHA